jgi:hypothetical protein
LVVTAFAIIAIFALTAVATDARLRVEARAEVQAVANAVAAGSVADLPKGAVAVIRTAGTLFLSERAGTSWRQSGEQDVQIGRWDASGQTFSTGMERPNAIRVTIRLRNEPGPFATFLGSACQPIEASAIAVREPLDQSLATATGNGAQTTLKSFARHEPTIILPAHDPNGPCRLAAKQVFAEPSCGTPP